jgi:hypothetical protein
MQLVKSLKNKIENLVADVAPMAFTFKKINKLNIVALMAAVALLTFL